MGKGYVKTTPKERLARILKQSSSIPELKEFREQCRDVYRLGGLLGLDEWVDARRDYGLFDDSKRLKTAADDLQGVIGSVIDAATIKPPPASSGLSWEERIERINEREEIQRNNVPKVGYSFKPSVVSRMEQGFDALIDEAIAMPQRDVP